MAKQSKSLIAALAVIPFLIVLAACSPLTAINALSSSSASRVTPNLAYGSGPRQRLDIYAPKNAKAPAPVVVFFYGGNWASGQRADYAFVGHALASRGMVAVIADYRLYPDVHYPEILQDTAQAAAWAFKEIGRYGGDPQRLFVMGHSAGAYNAAMVALDASLLKQHGLTPSMLRGWIGLAGPYDFLPIENPDARPVFFYPNTPADSQPINHVETNAPAALLIAANNDKLVNPVRNTGGLARSLRAHKVPVTELYYDKVSHATLVASLSGPLRFLAPTLDAVEAFVASDGGRAPATAAASVTTTTAPAPAK